MLYKKHTLLLPHWLYEYLEEMSIFWEMKLPEIIRAEICFSVLTKAEHLGIDYKPSFPTKMLIDLLKRQEKGKLSKENKKKCFAELEFEAHKAIEIRLLKMKKTNQKKPKKNA